MKERAFYWIVVLAIIALAHQGICGEFQTNSKRPLSTCERWEAVGKFAAERSIDLIKKAASVPQKGNMIVLTNSGYAEVNGESTQGSLDGLASVAGASRGRNTLVEINSSSWAPLWFAVYDKSSGYCAYLELDSSKAAEIAADAASSMALFRISAIERIDAAHLTRLCFRCAAPSLVDFIAWILRRKRPAQGLNCNAKRDIQQSASACFLQIPAMRLMLSAGVSTTEAKIGGR